jgi:hypothetical protein
MFAFLLFVCICCSPGVTSPNVDSDNSSQNSQIILIILHFIFFQVRCFSLNSPLHGKLCAFFSKTCNGVPEYLCYQHIRQSVTVGWTFLFGVVTQLDVDDM